MVEEERIKPTLDVAGDDQPGVGYEAAPDTKARMKLDFSSLVGDGLAQTLLSCSVSTLTGDGDYHPHKPEAAVC